MICADHNKVVGESVWDGVEVVSERCSEICLTIAFPTPANPKVAFFWLLWMWRPSASDAEAKDFCNLVVQELLQAIDRECGRVPTVQKMETQGVRTLCYILHL